MRLLRMKPGHGEVLIAEGDVEIAEQELELIEAFRAQLDQGMWAAVPVVAPDGRRQAELVRAFDEIPRDADRVIGKLNDRALPIRLIVNRLPSASARWWPSCSSGTWLRRS